MRKKKKKNWPLCQSSLWGLNAQDGICVIASFVDDESRPRPVSECIRRLESITEKQVRWTGAAPGIYGANRYGIGKCVVGVTASVIRIPPVSNTSNVNGSLFGVAIRLTTDHSQPQTMQKV